MFSDTTTIYYCFSRKRRKHIFSKVCGFQVILSFLAIVTFVWTCLYQGQAFDEDNDKLFCTLMVINFPWNSLVYWKNILAKLYGYSLWRDNANALVLLNWQWNLLPNVACSSRLPLLISLTSMSCVCNSYLVYTYK